MASRCGCIWRRAFRVSREIEIGYSLPTGNTELDHQCHEALRGHQRRGTRINFSSRKRTDARVSLEVEISGPGFAQAILIAVFSSILQQEKPGGWGLGLVDLRSIIEAITEVGEH